MKTKKRLMFLSLFAASSLLYSAELTEFDAIDIAGKQSMISQKILKDYAMIGMKNDFGEPRKDMEDLLKEFSSNLESIKTFYKNNKKVYANIEIEEKAFNKIKPKLKNSNKEKALEVKNDLDNLLKISNNVVISAEKEKKNEYEKDINMAGKERMLSQKIGAIYMYKAWGINPQEMNTELKENLKEANMLLHKIKKSKLNDSETKKYEDKIASNLLFIKMLGLSDKKLIPSLIYKKSCLLLSYAKKLTTKFIENSKKGVEK